MGVVFGDVEVAVTHATVTSGHEKDLRVEPGMINSLRSVLQLEVRVRVMVRVRVRVRVRVTIFESSQA